MSARISDELGQMALELRRLGRPRVPEAARQRIWKSARARVALAAAAPARRPWQLSPFFRAFAGAVAVFGLLFAGALLVTARSLPGDALYPMARDLEARGLAWLPAPQRASLELQLLNRRAAEVRRLTKRGDPVPQELIAEIALGASEIAVAFEDRGGKPDFTRQVAALQLAAAAYPSSRQVAGALEMTTAAQRSSQQ